MIVLFPQVGYVFIPWRVDISHQWRGSSMRLFWTAKEPKILLKKSTWRMSSASTRIFFCYKKHLQTNGKTGNPGCFKQICIHIEYRTRVPIYTLKIYSWFKWSHSKLIENFWTSGTCRNSSTLAILNKFIFWSGLPSRNLKNWWLEDDPFLLRCPSFCSSENWGDFSVRSWRGWREIKKWQRSCVCHFLLGEFLVKTTIHEMKHEP